MLQMYKVFVNDKPIILTDSLKNDNNFPAYIFNEVVIDEILLKLKRGNTSGAYLFCSNLAADWSTFQKEFKVVYAGGGLVTNPNKEILFIYRSNVWDLPKGRVEAGESIEKTAVREVEEECGAEELKLIEHLLITHHLFYMDNIQQMKITHWFLMEADFQKNLKPQLEEGITKVLFKNKDEVQEAMKNTYANIKLVLDAYYKN
jgi:ADP-ribose pyrophosphatase YjhB (NUDIX family)